MINIFYKDYPQKLTTMSLPLDSVPPIAKLIVKLIIKQKCGKLTKSSV